MLYTKRRLCIPALEDWPSTYTPKTVLILHFQLPAYSGISFRITEAPTDAATVCHFRFATIE
jgi:hypothetical protein